MSIQKLEQSVSPTACLPKVIVRAEPTLAGILKTLDTDYVKIQVCICREIRSNTLNW